MKLEDYTVERPEGSTEKLNFIGGHNLQKLIDRGLLKPGDKITLYASQNLVRQRVSLPFDAKVRDRERLELPKGETLRIKKLIGYWAVPD